MILKGKIKEAALKYKRESGFSQDEDSFQDGADFAIKAVIEMLEDRVYLLGEIGKCDEQDECLEIIKLLKSEA